MKRRKHVIVTTAEEFQAAMRDSWSEADFTAAVIALAQEHHWLCVHMRPARTDKGWRTAGVGDIEGWPDIAAAKVGYRNVFLELKVKNRMATKKQVKWLDALHSGGAIAATVWPWEWALLVNVFAGKGALLEGGR
jgi:hypothetical protein